MSRFFSNEVFAVMHNRNFRLFLAYRFFMTSATLMQAVIVGWQLYDITKNPLSLGMIGLTEVIPQVCIALFAGHFVDIWDRKRIMSRTSLLLLVGSAHSVSFEHATTGRSIFGRDHTHFYYHFYCWANPRYFNAGPHRFTGAVGPARIAYRCRNLGQYSLAGGSSYRSGIGGLNVWFSSALFRLICLYFHFS